MHKSQSLFYLTTALHVSGVNITHLQENKTTVTTASGNRYTVLLSAAIVEELELSSNSWNWVPTLGTEFQLLELSSNAWNWVPTLGTEFQLFHDSSRQQYGVTVTRCCSYSCLCSWRWVIVTPETCRAVVK